MVNHARAVRLERRTDWRRVGSWVVFILGAAAMAALALASIAYLLRPQWAEAPPPDVPALPIVVAGAVFNVPPGVIRVAMQRHGGPQERIDLAYRWSELLPAAASSTATASAPHPELFVTIQRSEGLLPAAERLKSIYPRYFDEAAQPDASGLMIRPFGDGTPYQGEDVLYDPAAPERFLVRCSRPKSEPVWATCIYERAIGNAALTFRFPRAWLTEWRAVNAGIDRLIEGWRPAGK